MSDLIALLTLDQAAECLTLSTRAMRRLIDDRKLPYIRVSSGRVAIDPDDLKAYIKGQKWLSEKTAGDSSLNSCKGESAYSVAVQPESRKRKRKNSKRGSVENGSTGMSLATRKT